MLNTDNMSIVGVTIDYGPFGFIDRFDPDFICNASDDGGRYTYAAQPEICKWNLGKLAEALAPVLPRELSGKEARFTRGKPGGAGRGRRPAGAAPWHQLAGTAPAPC